MTFLEFTMPPNEPTQHPVSSVRVVFEPSHDALYVWNRGGLAGRLMLTKGDWREFVTRLGFVSSEPTRRGEQRPTRPPELPAEPITAEQQSEYQRQQWLPRSER